MASIFRDGFDKYGPAGTNLTNALLAGAWTSVNGNTSIVAGLSASGTAVKLAIDGAIGSTLSKTLPGSYTTIVGGFRFNASLNAVSGIIFCQGSTGLFSIGFNTTGTIVVWSGRLDGSPSLLAQSSASVSANSTHYLEWQVTVGANAAYAVWLDGVQIISGTGNTGSGAVDTVLFNGPSGGYATTLIVDDLYLFDTTGTHNNAPLLTNPRIITTFPDADVQRVFAYGAGPSSTSNWPDVSNNPPQDSSSYVYSGNIGDEDLYQPGTVGVTGSSMLIYDVAINVRAALSDAGPRTMTIQAKSGATDSAGAAQTPTTSYAWFASAFETDPATGAAWTQTGRNAAAVGVKVAT